MEPIVRDNNTINNMIFLPALLPSTLSAHAHVHCSGFQLRASYLGLKSYQHLLVVGEVCLEQTLAGRTLRLGWDWKV